MFTLAQPGVARAYRTFEDDGSVAAPARWSPQTIVWEISSAGNNPEDGSLRISFGSLRAAAAAGIEVWVGLDCDGAAIGGEDFAVGFSGATTLPAAAGDGRNTVSVVTSDWTGHGHPAGRGATTDVQLRRYEDGSVEIVEADIYINAADYQFASGEPTGEELDLTSVLTHEAGHLFGLLHPCELNGESGAPRCTEGTDRESSLYPVYLGVEGESPSDDDRRGLCSLYRGEVCQPSCDDNEGCVEGRCAVVPCEGPGCPGSTECLDSDDCSLGVCGVWGPEVSHCISAGAYGAPCASAADCTSRLCLTSAYAGEQYCTSACTSDSDCAADERCFEVEAHDVCVPRVPPSGTCSASRTNNTSAAWIGALVMVMEASRRRRARQRSQG